MISVKHPKATSPPLSYYLRWWLYCFNLLTSWICALRASVRTMIIHDGNPVEVREPIVYKTYFKLPASRRLSLAIAERSWDQHRTCTFFHIYMVLRWSSRCDLDLAIPLSTLSDHRSDFRAPMPRKVLAGFGVDVDAVAGWYVIFHSIMTRVSNEDYHAGLGLMEAKILHWKFLE